MVAIAVADVASQAEEGGRLYEQVIGHGAVRRMADRAVFGHRRVLIGERTLFLGVAFPAQQVERFRPQVAFHLPVCVVAIGAEHLALLDRVMRRQRELGEDVRMALVAGAGSLTDMGRRFGRATSKWLMPTICGTLALAWGVWQSVQATPMRACVDECQAMVGVPDWWQCRHRSCRELSRMLPCVSWHVVQLKPLGPQIWCGPAICCMSCLSPWQR